MRRRTALGTPAALASDAWTSAAPGWVPDVWSCAIFAGQRSRHISGSMRSGCLCRDRNVYAVPSAPRIARPRLYALPTTRTGVSGRYVLAEAVGTGSTASPPTRVARARSPVNVAAMRSERCWYPTTSRWVLSVVL